jgi:alkanesulfonate monooxygenase SsuD/methylene tetrahydromethanopterin reductase-like flavin-dependent oxidoreductase (luciferase family)
MKFHYFGGHVSTTSSNIDELEDAHCDGILFTYRQWQGDFFTFVARTMKLDQKIKYMIAIRPHALSPQYLCMINQSINEIQPERLQINIIAGHIKPDEVDFGGILGTVTDASSIPDRTNYMIDYLKELRDMEGNGVQIPECYVTCTNIHSLEAVAKLGYKIIFPYREYKFGYFLDKSVDGQLKPGVGFDLSGKKIMLAISPIIRDTQEEIDNEFPKDIVVHTQDGKSYLDRKRFLNDTAYFTYDNFVRFVKELESKGINEILFNGSPESERDNLIKYIKRYKETE